LRTAAIPSCLISFAPITCCAAADTLTLTDTQNRFKALGVFQ